ncbi:MAG TPA: glycyl-radical enzyme activating protein [Clostridiales bacterium]|jgi:pyruvate formate lyase activating enzyme|nr:glycyl-radical enzyme activating protein [Clostridiales bacterium]
MITANVFDIKRFSINDGDGIRTTIFLKGCPLACKWCQNPEGLIPEIRLWYARNICVSCKSCIVACEENALRWDDRGVAIDHASCTRCSECVVACPTGAIRFDAREMSVAEALEEIKKDRPFYGTDGGVTLSGGECMVSPAFSLGVLRGCRECGINAQIETSLYARPEIVDAFAETTDKIIADIKLIDPARHYLATGVDNALILSNIRRLAQQDTNLLIRVPLIPGFTDDEENMRGIAKFVSSLGRDIPVELLNFNPMCREKYESLRKTYQFDPDEREIPQQRVDALKQILTDCGLVAI